MNQIISQRAPSVSRISGVLSSFAMALLLSGCQVEGVVSMDGQPQAGIVVMLSDGESTIQRVTDSSGAYVFDAPAGSYYVSMQPPAGYEGVPGRRIYKSSDMADVSAVDFNWDNTTAVTIPQGTYYGDYVDDEVGLPTGVVSYQGIRAAMPPLNERRWQAPKPVPESDAAMLAIAPGDMCIQLGDKLNAAPTALYGTMIGSEDCLFLNIWRPTEATPESPLPVMVWIYGGGNSLGEASTYSGQYLADAHNVVVVNFNYRMGPLGWFSLPQMHASRDAEAVEDTRIAETRSGNYGTLDQINALRWVNQNILAFGGDPENVMVFGESAGASATLAMMASPLTEGLFHKAAVQSAALGWITDHTIWQARSRAENPVDAPQPGYKSSSYEILASLLQRDQIISDRSELTAWLNDIAPADLSAYLKELSPQDLYSLYETKLGAFIDMPTVIQDGYVIPEKDVLTLFRDGDYHRVPVILGTNRDEYKLFLLSRPDYTTEVADVLPLIQSNHDYQKAGRHYSDAWQITAGFELATAIADNQSEVYLYRFDWDEEPNLVVMDMAEVLGAAHGLEIGYTLNNPDLAVTPSLSFALFTESNRSGRQYLADVMSSYWANLAWTGTPGQGREGTLAEWTPWQNDHRLMVFDTPEDQGSTIQVAWDTREDLKHRVLNDSEFDSSSRYCTLVTEIFGTSDVAEQDCDDLL